MLRVRTEDTGLRLEEAEQSLCRSPWRLQDRGSLLPGAQPSVPRRWKPGIPAPPIPTPLQRPQGLAGPP